MKKHIHVPYAEKDEAKTLGAKWDSNFKMWYIPEGVENKPFEKWFLSPRFQQAKRTGKTKTTSYNGTGSTAGIGR